MVSALQRNAIDEFKRYYRSVDVLLIDDIQFFVRKERSQEEFFHTFNALLKYQRQVVLTCDRYPRAVDGLEERLTSRFSRGLTVEIELPDTETRTAILMRKAEEAGFDLSGEVAFFIAERIRSNVRELEGALRRVIANAQFTHRPITLELTKEALRDVLALHDKLITIENIQQTVARYYKVRVADLLSKRRSRSIRPPPADRDGPGQRADQPQLPGDSRCLRGQGSLDRPACLPEGARDPGRQHCRRRGVRIPRPDPEHVGCCQAVHKCEADLHGQSCTHVKQVLPALSCRFSAQPVMSYNNLKYMDILKLSTDRGRLDNNMLKGIRYAVFC